MRGVRSTNGGEERFMQGIGEKTVEDLGIRWRIKLKWIFKK